jgi:hypothetical protein
MGFLNWFLAKPANRQFKNSIQNEIHNTLADATRPLMPSMAKPTAQPATSASAQRLEQRRLDRNARRELLFEIVRESMLRVGVLSSAFKFKVLALDQRGQTFLVMIDLSADFAGETDKLSEIEALISQAAKTRFDLIVQAVYWRFFDTVMTNSGSRQGAASGPAPMFGLTTNSRPAPLSAQPFPAIPSSVEPLARPKPAADSLSPNVPKADPLQRDEVEAFKRALASGAQPGLSIPLGGATPSYTSTQAFPMQPEFALPPQAAPVSAPVAAATKPKPTAAKPTDTKAGASQAAPNPAVLATAASAAKAASLTAINNKLLLTGYEDTVMPDPDAPLLSATQYGELR